ncbi:hypothetical protein CDAR_98111 [Caerostris darwini]|uniref:Uncharacterized protein n=1 Tax=Caerostris darwini TaxID=1538125 RepID=A0AAV4UFK4_9ARAC|nr:hypothetical protein CDAR_98111 [Caerostris darwini]
MGVEFGDIKHLEYDLPDRDWRYLDLFLSWVILTIVNLLYGAMILTSVVFKRKTFITGFIERSLLCVATKYSASWSLHNFLKLPCRASSKGKYF